MGLFTKKYREPRIHPVAKRTITVSSRLEDTTNRINAYGSLHSEKHSIRHPLVLTEEAGRTTIELPARVHPWTFHNLGFWLLDTPGGTSGTVLRSSPTPDHPGYTLVRDPELEDCLCGLDDHGDGWTVSVPTNDIARPTEVPVTVDPDRRVPGVERHLVTVLMEDPGHDLNPLNDPTRRSRRQLTIDTTSFSV